MRLIPRADKYIVIFDTLYDTQAIDAGELKPTHSMVGGYQFDGLTRVRLLKDLRC